jgi:rhamnosyltransferase
MKLATITLAYKCNLDELCHNLASYAESVDLLILWDNSETPLDLSALKVRFPKVVIHQDGTNHGLPKAYNWAIDYALSNGYTHIMTMDQDSCFENFDEYRRQIDAIKHPGICSCAINREHPSNEEWTTINDSAQSGSVFPLAMIEKIGLFREDLFISMVDAEMCLRAQEHGYRTLQYNGSNLIHQIGSGRKIKVLGHAVHVSDYNALRHYYDSRNRILMWHEFPYDISLRGKIKHLVGRLKVIIKILLFETDKIEKTRAIVVGTFWGLMNKSVPYKRRK